MGDVTNGGCHCGGVRFRIEGPLDRVLVCHCGDCMKTVGNSMAATAVLDRQIEITGDSLKWYRSSREAERGFCTVCGATMFYRREGNTCISIAAGMLDDPSVLEFAGHVFLHGHPGHQPLEADPVDLHEQFMDVGRVLPGDES